LELPTKCATNAPAIARAGALSCQGPGFATEHNSKFTVGNM